MLGNIQTAEGNLLEILLASPAPLLKFIFRLVNMFGVFNCVLMTVVLVIIVIWIYSKSP